MSAKQRSTRTTTSDMTSLRWEQVRAWRLRRHGLDERAPREEMLAVVSQIAGLHAQVMSSAELSLWARVQAITRTDVQHAVWEERSLVKTWAMRGTLHLLPADEYAIWQAALGTYRHYLRPSWKRYFGVEPVELATTVAQALDGRLLTREELAAEVVRITGTAELAGVFQEGWGTVLKPAAFRGDLCFAPSRGQHVRFTRPRTWLPDGYEPTPDGSPDALRAVLRRFLGAYAPATREDFARWWGMSPAAAGRLIAGLGEAVAQVEVEGWRAWMFAEHVAEAAAAALPRSVRLLPGFDPYVIGATGHAEILLPGPYRERIHRAQGWVSPVLLVDGRMDGVWRHERAGKRLLVTIEPFVELPAWVRQRIEEEAARLAGFLGGTLDLRLG